MKKRLTPEQRAENARIAREIELKNMRNKPYVIKYKFHDSEYIRETVHFGIDEEDCIQDLRERFVGPIEIVSIEEEWLGVKEYSYNEEPTGHIIMTTTEAAEKWGLKENTVRAALTRGRFDNQIMRGIVRKSGKIWLVTEQAMREIYGEPIK